MHSPTFLIVQVKQMAGALVDLQLHGADQPTEAQEGFSSELQGQAHTMPTLHQLKVGVILIRMH